MLKHGKPLAIMIDVFVEYERLGKSLGILCTKLIVDKPNDTLWWGLGPYDSEIWDAQRHCRRVLKKLLSIKLPGPIFRKRSILSSFSPCECTELSIMIEVYVAFERLKRFVEILRTRMAADSQDYSWELKQARLQCRCILNELDSVKSLSRERTTNKSSEPPPAAPPPYTGPKLVFSA